MLSNKVQYVVTPTLATESACKQINRYSRVAIRPLEIWTPFLSLCCLINITIANVTTKISPLITCSVHLLILRGKTYINYVRSRFQYRKENNILLTVPQARIQNCLDNLRLPFCQSRLYFVHA